MAAPKPHPGSGMNAPARIGTRLREGVARAAGAVCALALCAMALGIVAEIVARSFFHYSFRSIEELSGYLLVAITFLGLCVAVHTGSLFRVELLIERLSARSRRALDLAICALFIVFLALLDYQCVSLVIDSYRGGYVAPTLLATPLYIPQLFMPLGITATLVVLTVRFGEAWAAFLAAADDDGRRGR